MLTNEWSNIENLIFVQSLLLIIRGALLIPYWFRVLFLYLHLQPVVNRWRVELPMIARFFTANTSSPVQGQAELARTKCPRQRPPETMNAE